MPEKLTYKEAVAASSIANVMIAAILNGDLPLAGKMMEQDKWHETYRRSLVPHLKEIRRLTQQRGAYGSFLSGAAFNCANLVARRTNQRNCSKFGEIIYQSEHPNFQY